MLTRIQPRAVADLARRDLPGPLDVVNLIQMRNLESYRWYALLVWPAMTLVRARVLWMGRLEVALEGEAHADKLLLVRYPSHRRFLAMTLNPYYAAINRLREAGVTRFEASFTSASQCAGDLARRRRLVGVHFASRAGGDALESVRAVLDEAGGELVYATRAVASLRVLEPPKPTDPHPMTLGELALFEVAQEREAALAALAPRLGEVTERFALALYRREPRSAYRPALLWSRPAGAVAR